MPPVCTRVKPPLGPSTRSLKSMLARSSALVWVGAVCPLTKSTTMPSPMTIDWLLLPMAKSLVLTVSLPS
ncbi:hypothetical protein D3C81_1628650 [compost metagenome]